MKRLLAHFSCMFYIYTVSDPVYCGAPLTKGQSLVLFMSYILRHNLTAVSVHHLLKIFNEHFPGMVPVTTYFFPKSVWSKWNS